MHHLTQLEKLRIERCFLVVLGDASKNASAFDGDFQTILP